MRSVVFVAAVMAACSAGSTSGTEVSGKPKVAALSYPSWYLVKRIGALRVDASLSVPDGTDPATWTPSGDEIGALSSADLIIMNGAGYEGWVATASLPESKLVDTAAGVEVLNVEGPAHHHGSDGAHAHREPQPQVWADPSRYAQQARAVHQALVQADPAAKAAYDGQLQGVERQLTELSSGLDTQLAALGQRPLVASSPVFSYWSGRAGVTIKNENLDAATAPSEERLAELATAYPSGAVILWSTPPSGVVASALPAFSHVSLSGLDQPKPGQAYDYVVAMRVNLEMMKRASQEAASVDGTDGTDAPE
ncbi:MAG: metal ABC transporter solute-binding protein, Zn/Mn family [Myxococcota bacterium]